MTMSSIDPREQRARKFANEIMGLTHDWLPSGRELQSQLYDLLYKTAYDGNLQILNVMPEYDHLTKLQLEHMMLETHPMTIIKELSQ